MINRKVFIVSLYYHEGDPEPTRRDVSKAIEKAVYKSKKLLVFDAVAEEARTSLFSMDKQRIITRYLYRFLINRRS